VFAPLTWSRRTKIISATIGALLAGSVAFAATNWTVGLSTGSSGQAQSGAIQNISIVAIATPAPTNLLYPGATGDVVAKITNPNAFPVTITGVNLPTNTTYASGFSDSALSAAQTGCSSSTSLVAWTFATATSGSAHTLTTPITVAGNGNITITFTNDATMGNASPAACQSTYFSMPSLTGVIATGGAATATVATTDSWTS
jgi:hypothetical protein